MLLASIVCLLGISATAFGSRAVSNCTAPRAPENSDAFMYQDGQVVKYVCDPGYVLIGRQIVRCIDGQWEEPIPVCKKMNDETAEEVAKPDPPSPPEMPERPLFNWGKDDESEKNETADEEKPSNDEGRVRVFLYPRQSIFTTRFRPTRLQSGTELEEEERKRSQTADKKTAEDGNSKRQVVSFPRAPVAVAQNDKGYQDDLRHAYYMAHYYYPLEYRSGSPVAATLSHSQMAWINSLHPELRDQYLRDLYFMRSDETADGVRAHNAFLRRYGNAYNILYNPYVREPMALLSDDPVSAYDYSCNQAHSSFVKAPRLPNMHIARYDRRQNPNPPNNNYLSAVYRCNPGYIMLDTRHTELHCSNRRWIGVHPICVRRG